MRSYFAQVGLVGSLQLLFVSADNLVSLCLGLLHSLHTSYITSDNGVPTDEMDSPLRASATSCEAFFSASLS